VLFQGLGKTLKMAWMLWLKQAALRATAWA